MKGILALLKEDTPKLLKPDIITLAEQKNKSEQIGRKQKKEGRKQRVKTFIKFTGYRGSIKTSR